MIVPYIVPSHDPIGRLQRYSRFVALVAEQLDALCDEDMERFRRLTGERQALDRELLEAAATEDRQDVEFSETEDGATLARLQDELESAIAELDERLAAERWKKEQLALLTEGAMKSARSVPMIRPIGRAYPEVQQRTHHLDRRF